MVEISYLLNVNTNSLLVDFLHRLGSNQDNLSYARTHRRRISRDMLRAHSCRPLRKADRWLTRIEQTKEINFEMFNGKFVILRPSLITGLCNTFCNQASGYHIIRQMNFFVWTRHHCWVGLWSLCQVNLLHLIKWINESCNSEPSLKNGLQQQFLRSFASDSKLIWKCDF